MDTDQAGQAGQTALAKRVENGGDTSPGALMALAFQHNADPATLAKLMDLQERWDAMQARKAFVEAMTAFKATVPSVLRKDAVVDFNSAKGHTHFTHASLGGIIAEITAGLSQYGLSVSWETKQGQGVVSVTCHVMHAAGHRESVTLNGPPDDTGLKNPIQQIGSSVTYLQRYTLLAVLGLATADQDDADDPHPAGMRQDAPGRAAPAMPTRKAAPAAPATPAASQAAPQRPQAARQEPAPRTAQPEAEPEPESGVVAGPVERLAQKSGTTNGKKWIKYGIKIGGQWYDTFSSSQADMAKQAKEEGYDIEIHYTVAANGFRDIVPDDAEHDVWGVLPVTELRRGEEPDGAPAAPPPGQGDDDLPF